MKFKDWLNKWLYLTEPTIKRCSFERYATYAELQIKPLLGELELEEITNIVIQNFVATLSQRYAPSTINSTLFVVKRSLTCAEELEATTTHYNFKVHYRVKRSRELKCLTIDEQKKLERFIDARNNCKMFGLKVCLYTGLRVGELIALEWEDIDFVKKTITVNKTCHDRYTKDGYEKFIDSPKTYSSKRIIPIPRQLFPYLETMKKTSKSKFVISGKNGKIVSKRSYQKTFDSVLERLGLPHMGIHSLRHTFATRALECGMDVKTLSEILGHKNATITLNTYAHSLSEHKRAMMNKVGKNLL